MNNGASNLSSSFRGELPERGRGDAAGVSFPKLSGDNGDWAHERATQPGCNCRRRKVRRDHAIFLSQNVENGALRPSPHSSEQVMPP